VPWEKCASASRLIDKLKNPPAGGGYKIFAVEQSKKSIPYYLAGMTRHTRVVVVVGNEVKGVSPAILKKADKILEIPMRGQKESLNVAVAFGIVAFDLLFRHK